MAYHLIPGQLNGLYKGHMNRHNVFNDTRRGTNSLGFLVFKENSLHVSLLFRQSRVNWSLGCLIPKYGNFGYWSRLTK